MLVNPGPDADYGTLIRRTARSAADDVRPPARERSGPSNTE